MRPGDQNLCAAEVRGPRWLARGSEGVTEKGAEAGPAHTGRKLEVPAPDLLLEERSGEALPQKSDLGRRVKAQSQEEEGEVAAPI